MPSKKQGGQPSEISSRSVTQGFLVVVTVTVARNNMFLVGTGAAVTVMSTRAFKKLYKDFY